MDVLLGQPLQLEFSGVSLDAAYRVAEPIARDASSASARDWMRLAALQGSTLEAKIFRDLFLLDALSADLGLRQALAQSIPLLTVDASNIDAVLPGLLHPAEVLEDLRNWVRLGLTVTIPQTQIVYNEWQGSVWRVQDGASGAGGYFIAGGLAGGTTTERPNGWLLIWLAQALTSSNAIPPSNDELSVASLTRISSTDGQEAEVGETLPAQLSVIARDDGGKPVAGARVTFRASAGGGKFNGEDSVEVVTNGAGIASAAFTLGERTDANPRYRRIDDSDRYYSRVGLNLVEASAVSRSGLVIIDQPFSAIGYPGEVTQLVRTNAPQEYGQPNMWAQNIQLQPRDQYHNPIANVDTSFTITTQGSSCTDPKPSEILPGRIFDTRLDANGKLGDSCPASPILGDCGAPSKTLTSNIFGVSAGIILGNTPQTAFTVTASANSLSQSYIYRTSGACNAGPRYGVLSTSVSNVASESINAVRAGEEFARPVEVRVVLIEPRIDRVTDGKPVYLPETDAYPVNAKVEYSVSNGGSAGAIKNSGVGIYSGKVTTGSAPGINTVSAKVRDIVANQFIGRLQNAGVKQELVDSAKKFLKDGTDADVSDIYGLETAIIAVESPTPPGMDDNAIFVNEARQAEFGAEILYRVLPGEYPISFAEIDLYEDGTLRASLPATTEAGGGRALVIRSTEFDPDRRHEAEVILNRGSIVEVRSDPFEIPIGQRLFSEYPNFFKSAIDIDTLNQRVCTQGSVFRFTTTQDARITLEFTDRDDEDDVTTIADDRFFAAGEHELTITPLELLPGNYSFELKGVAIETGLTEIKQGGAFSHYSTRDQLPVGHTLVKGVNVFNGGLAVSSNDMTLPGRGVPLDFTRTYSSLGSEAPGRARLRLEPQLRLAHRHHALRRGHRHRRAGRRHALRRGRQWRAQAAQGLPRHPDPGRCRYSGRGRTLSGGTAFDFFSKDGTRYHYVNRGISERQGMEPRVHRGHQRQPDPFGYDPVEHPHGETDRRRRSGRAHT